MNSNASSTGSQGPGRRRGGDSGTAGRGAYLPSRPGRTAEWATGFALLFLSFSLLALALVPMRLEQDVRAQRTRIREVLEPSQRLAARIQSLQARQMEAFYSFLLMGDPGSRVRYREAKGEERAVLDTLGALTQEMSLQVREAMANLVPLTFSWHLGHEEMLLRDVSGTEPGRAGAPELSQERLRTEQATYAEVRAAGENLTEALAAEMRVGEAAMSRARLLQTQSTQILAFLGLVATVVVLALAWHLRTLMREAHARRKEALLARREADALLRATGDGVLGMDLQGRCTFLNRAGAELLGYPARMVVGRDVHDLLHHSYPDGHPLPREECTILQGLASGKTVSGRNENLWRAGREPFPVQITLRPMLDGTETRGAVLSFTDMTETRAAEASLRQAVQARDEVLAVVSHDLRNPVGTIVAGASLLLTLNPSPEKRREHLQAIKRSAQRINRLIQDLLDVARLEVGALSVHPRPFQIRSVLEEVEEAHQRRAEEQNLGLVVRVPPGLEQGWGDRHRIIQALTNLVENALRVTDSGGTITLGARVQEGGEAVCFFVQDTGPGIPQEDQTRLFDRFWQVSRKGKGGAGLGLSIVKGIAEAHGGEVGVESQVGEGSTFWFTVAEEPEGE